MKKARENIDEFSRHEVYDRASLVLELFADAVQEHPVVMGDKVLAAEAQKAADALYNFYNLAAQRLMANDLGKGQKQNSRARKRRASRSSTARR